MNHIEQYLKQTFPFWDNLSSKQQKLLQSACTIHTAKKGKLIYGGVEECNGLLLVISGQLRAYIVSEEGKEVTLYRLLPQDICIFSASCILKQIHFDVMIQAEQDTTFLKIESEVYQQLMEQSAAVANQTNQMMAARFSDVMWLIERILFQRMDTRVAALLLEESQLSGTNHLQITHEGLANHLGTAREVVTRILKYLQAEKAIQLSRGHIFITDVDKLTCLAQNIAH